VILINIFSKNSVALSVDGKILMIGAYGAGYAYIYEYLEPTRHWNLRRAIPGEAEKGFETNQKMIGARCITYENELRPRGADNENKIVNDFPLMNCNLVDNALGDDNGQLQVEDYLLSKNTLKNVTPPSTRQQRVCFVEATLRVYL